MHSDFVKMVLDEDGTKKNEGEWVRKVERLWTGEFDPCSYHSRGRDAFRQATEMVFALLHWLK